MRCSQAWDKYETFRIRIVLDLAEKTLDSFQIEIPSWGFANTGTRFGKFVQAAAALNHRRKVCGCGRSEQPDWRNAHACTACAFGSLPNGIADVARGEKSGAPLRHSRRINQPKPVSGSGVQVWLAVQSIGGDSQTGRGSRSGFN